MNITELEHKLIDLEGHIIECIENTEKIMKFLNMEVKKELEREERERQ